MRTTGSAFVDPPPDTLCTTETCAVGTEPWVLRTTEADETAEE